MLHYPRWKIILIVCVVVYGCMAALPNLVGRDGRAWMADHLPSVIPSKGVNLGLDLQGGSHILLDVDFDTVFADHMEGMADSLRSSLREAGIPFSMVNASRDAVVITLQNATDAAAARTAVRTLDPAMQMDTSGAVITLNRSESQNREIVNHTIAQTIEIVRRRVDETGTNEPIIQRQGDTRVLVQLPGVEDPQRIKTLLGKTAKLGFHLVDERATGTGRGGAGAVVLPMMENPEQHIGIKRRPMITGDMLTSAMASFTDGLPVVNFRLDARGTDRFCRVSTDNVGKPFAIVLDNEVISAPVLREPICGGQGQISGGFTVQEANDLGLLLRAGALPAPLTIVEERSIGPSLGVDSIDAGKKAAFVAFGFVVVFMTLSYGIFGVLSIVSLVINLTLIYAILSLMQATLTLPGIAGIVLTIGMAVDANILIYERMREEYLQGRSILGSLQSGFENAFSTIVDANLTGLIAAVMLYNFGTGPIKGFAVTLTIGIVTTMFTAVMVTKLLIYMWSKKTKAKTFPLAERKEGI